MRTSKWMCGMILSAAAAAGCVTEGSLREPAPDTPRAIVETGAVLRVIPAQTRLEVSARVDQGAGAEAARVTVPSVGGVIRVRGADDQLAIEALGLDLVPIEVPSTVIAGGLRLTGVHLALVAPAVTRDLMWSVDDDAALGSVALELDLDWAIDTGRGAYPLARQRLGPIAAVVAIGREGEAVTLDLDAWAPGPAWSWAGIVGVDDLSLSLTGVEDGGAAIPGHR